MFIKLIFHRKKKRKSKRNNICFILELNNYVKDRYKVTFDHRQTTKTGLQTELNETGISQPSKIRTEWRIKYI